MKNSDGHFVPIFSNHEQEIAYLKRKIDFLIVHAEKLADLHTASRESQVGSDLLELRNMKTSLSWRITRPLREINRLLKSARLLHINRSR